MPEAKRIIKNFNKLAKVLLEFEMLYHRGWLRQVLALCIIMKNHSNFFDSDFLPIVFYFTDGYNVL